MGGHQASADSYTLPYGPNTNFQDIHQNWNKLSISKGISIISAHVIRNVKSKWVQLKQK